jgi:hypothetical protein
MKKSKLKCGGCRRYGGAFTLGPVRWVECPNPPTVMLTFIEKRKSKTLPACKACWEECIEAKVDIRKVTPI